jgi:hypothetical protein
MDSLFDYLRACGGQDFLIFDSAEKASMARDLIAHQLEEDDVVFDMRPSLDLFDNQLRIRLKETINEPKPAEQAVEVF